jgi:hypothetical protein
LQTKIYQQAGHLFLYFGMVFDDLMI